MSNPIKEQSGLGHVKILEHYSFNVDAKMC